VTIDAGIGSDAVAGSDAVTVADVVAALDSRFPAQWAQSWDRVGLVVGETSAIVRSVLLAVDCVPETVDEALEGNVQLMVVHHPLLLRGVHSVATTSYKGALVHRLIRAGVALFVAHTNADVANPGVSDALADRLGLLGTEPVASDEPSPVRAGRLPWPMSLHDLTGYVAARLPATASGVRAAGDPDRMLTTLAVAGGAGDAYLADVTRAHVDAFLTADLRHHPASEHLAAGGPALLDAAHWATERPWLDVLAASLRAELPTETIVSDRVTDVWLMREPATTAGTNLASQP
jgi:dinuclear metal center YbgI/SA1388 family protein